MVYQRWERVRAKIILIVEDEKQGQGTINFITDDGIHRFANFATEDYDGVNEKFAGKDSDVFTSLKKAFDDDKWITLVLSRLNSAKDKVIRTEAYSPTPK